jgi:predicted RNase H-like HicB family nuclease
VLDADALEMDRIGTDMTLDDYNVVFYRNQPSGWVAEVPAIEGCYALMPTRQEALAELGLVFEMISEEFRYRRWL